MSVIVETRQATRGADNGPPRGISTSRELPRLGPLPEPSLLERLRASWSLAALVPAFDPRGLKAREWRSAGLAAIVVHALLLTAIVVVGKFALQTLGPAEQYEITRVGPNDFKPTPDDPTTGDDGTTKASDSAPNEGAPDGGSNTDPTPVTQGALPRSTPTPPIIPPNLKPILNPALPVDPSIQGPKFDVPTPTQIGLPDAPPPPGDPSAGNQGGPGVGRNPGDGGDDGDPRGGRPGGGRNGTGDPNGLVPGGPAGTNPNGTNPAPAGEPDHGPRMIRPVRAVPTQAMMDNFTFGTVSVRVTIGTDGRLLSAEAVNSVGHGGTQAALDAVRKCKFAPAVRGGQYKTETTMVTMTFQPK